MKASSVGWEIDIDVLDDEITRLGRGERLETLLKFHFPQTFEKIFIPLTLEYVPGRSEEIEVRQVPDNAPFGEAKQIGIVLQDYLYGCLKEEGMTGDRFFGSGKVLIRKKS